MKADEESHQDERSLQVPTLAQQPVPLNSTSLSGNFRHIQALSPEEAVLLAHCEEKMRESLRRFLDMGEALLTIQQQRLYRNSYDTFEDYCRERWQMSRCYAYRLIAAVELVTLLSRELDVPPPSNEALVRPLTSLDREVASRVWHRVATKANGKSITTRMVKEVVAQFQPESERPVKPKDRNGDTISSVLLWIAKAKLLVERGYRDDAISALEKIEHLLQRPSSSRNGPSSSDPCQSDQGTLCRSDADRRESSNQNANA